MGPRLGNDGFVAGCARETIVALAGTALTS
jgi:hypothetical protein